MKKLALVFLLLWPVMNLLAISGVLKQSTAVNATVVMIDSTDHVTGKTGLTLTIKASKAASAFATITPTVTELEGGIYKLAFTSSHTDTLGELRLRVTSAGADESDPIWQVVALLSGDVVKANVTQWNSNNVAVPVVTGVPIVDTTYFRGTPSQGNAGYAGIDWSHIGSPTTTVDLSGTTFKNVDNAIATVTNLTNLPSIPANWLTSSGIAAGALNGKGDWLLSSSYTAPPSAATVATTIWQDLTSGSDFTTSSSIGKLLVDDVNATISSRSTYAGADTSGTTTLLSRIPSALTITTGKVDVNDKTGFSLISAYDPAKVDIWNVTLPSTYTGQKAGALLWKIGNRP